MMCSLVNFILCQASAAYRSSTWLRDCVWILMRILVGHVVYTAENSSTEFEVTTRGMWHSCTVEEKWMNVGLLGKEFIYSTSYLSSKLVQCPWDFWFWFLIFDLQNLKESHLILSGKKNKHLYRLPNWWTDSREKDIERRKIVWTEWMDR